MKITYKTVCGNSCIREQTNISYMHTFNFIFNLYVIIFMRYLIISSTLQKRMYIIYNTDPYNAK